MRAGISTHFISIALKGIHIPLLRSFNFNASRAVLSLKAPSLTR
ncbi:hypothetical protein AAJ76_7800012101 [Vairimorpha ceranae]|uniref:Uncharacterized protein n=1 Tax=Vairimorpha ceranae TaxID=40302 RepID=A0A0F9W9T8_9MICR|nr:hypothetical protein AAJ76_7800012101 [Vairimorpha ceranae]KKO74381.1 hypothetical protein AAJ76_7800012101 [Vairimorpha ceranae]